jgi:hypothetical protein
MATRLKKNTVAEARASESERASKEHAPVLRPIILRGSARCAERLKMTGRELCVIYCSTTTGVPTFTRL